ncbi:MAG: hypothetical protein K2X11_20475 [Acetobacteraceae bacterium]|nr:hypothetical protein [Acetobacteraceae bacterium]
MFLSYHVGAAEGGAAARLLSQSAISFRNAFPDLHFEHVVNLFGDGFRPGSLVRRPLTTPAVTPLPPPTDRRGYSLIHYVWTDALSRATLELFFGHDGTVARMSTARRFVT